MLQTVGGITQVAPAWRVRYRPDFVGEHNETVVPTPQGPITGCWRKTRAGFAVELVLPPGSIYPG